MLISKFNLYKSEWLDLVFADRNKEYGAYYLRQHYADNMAKAMGITFLSIGLLCGASIVLKVNKPIEKMTPIDITPRMPPPIATPIKKPVTPPQSKPLKTQAAQPPIKTIQNLPPVVGPDDIAKKPVVNDHIDGQVGPVTTTGPAIDPGIPDNTQAGPGTPAPDNSVHLPTGLDVMPEPVGGTAAWAKFLNKNLRFPYEAQSEGASGKVYLSFIIEKDGRLSNIVIDRAAGHGFDEEAMRVLKMAKAWKPGIQNGQPVRVKYQIPINFQSAPAD